MSKTLRTSCRLMPKFYFSVVFFSVHDIFHSLVFKSPFTFSGRNPKFLLTSKENETKTSFGLLRTDHKSCL